MSSKTLRTSILVLISLTTVTLIFQNCGPGFESSTYRSPSSLDNEPYIISNEDRLVLEQALAVKNSQDSGAIVLKEKSDFNGLQAKLSPSLTYVPLIRDRSDQSCNGKPISLNGTRAIGLGIYDRSGDCWASTFSSIDGIESDSDEVSLVPYSQEQSVPTNLEDEEAETVLVPKQEETYLNNPFCIKVNSSSLDDKKMKIDVTVSCESEAGKVPFLRFIGGEKKEKKYHSLSGYKLNVPKSYTVNLCDLYSLSKGQLEINDFYAAMHDKSRKFHSDLDDQLNLPQTISCGTNSGDSTDSKNNNTGEEDRDPASENPDKDTSPDPEPDPNDNSNDDQKPTDKDVSQTPSKCSNDWIVLSSDKYGWMSNPVQGHGPSVHRFSRNKAPDGSMAIQHFIKKGEAIDKLGFDSPVFRPKKKACAIMLRYKQYNQSGKYRTQPGKYMSLMGGRGQAGGYYLNKEGAGPEGWSHYINSPVVSGSKGTSSAKNGLRGIIGSANRSQLGASCTSHKDPKNTAGGNPVQNDKNRCFEYQYGTSAAIPTGKWFNIEIVSVMNDNNKSNGEAYYTLNGKKHDSQKGIMWAKEPERSPEIFARWRMMYGGTPSKLPPPYDLKEWYKDFEILVAYPK